MSGNGKPGKILVIGGGISGITAAIEASEAGCDVVLVEKNPYLGGRVAQTNQYFPKLCPPSCGLEINFRRLRTSPRIRCLTLSEVEKITGEPGRYQATIRRHPRRVNNKCTACGACVEACPVERPDEFNFGMSTTKAIYLPFEMAYPLQYVIDGSVCPGTECGKCVPACPYDAIDLDMQPETIEVEVQAVIWATGWEPYDAGKIDGLGFGTYPNVITNVMMERLASPDGPTAGKIQRPSDGKEIETVAFVQCAGSRDENYLKHCSGVCCMGSLKQARYVREQYPDAQIYIFYIDIRAPGRLEDFYAADAEGREAPADQGQGGEDHRGRGQRGPGGRSGGHPLRRARQPEGQPRRAGDGHRPGGCGRSHRARRRSAERRTRVPDRAISPLPACWRPDAPSGRWTWRRVCGTPRAPP